MNKMKIFIATIPVVIVLVIIILLICNIKSTGLQLLLSVVFGVVSGLGILKYSTWLHKKGLVYTKEGEK